MAKEFEGLRILENDNVYESSTEKEHQNFSRVNGIDYHDHSLNVLELTVKMKTKKANEAVEKKDLCI